MQDYLIFLTASGEGREAFQDWLLGDLGPRIAVSPSCLELRINLAVEPKGGGSLYENEGREGEEFDATIDLACPSPAAFESLFLEFAAELEARTSRNFVYPVTKSPEHDDGGISGTMPSSGYKIMRGIFFHSDLPQTARARSWNTHVAAARRLHGFSRYVRYWVGDPVTEGSPKIHGATNLHFADENGWKERYFLQTDGRTQIAQDISHFISHGLARVFTKEYVLK